MHLILRPGLNRSNNILMALIAAYITSGCAFQRYQSKPILPAQIASSYESRDLDNPELKMFMGKFSDSLQDETWGIKSLTLAAFYYHPDLDIARNNLEVQKGKLLTAKQIPNPRGGINIGYNYTPGQIPVRPWLFTPSLDFIIETAGKRKLRVKQANYLIENARLNIGITAWQVRSRLRLQLINYLLEKEQFRLLKDELALRSEYVDSLQTLFDFGEIPVTEIELARINLNDARQRMIASEGLMEETKVLLANSIGIPVTALSNKIFDYPKLSNPPTLQQIDTIKQQAIFNNLNIQQGLMNYKVAESAFQLEVAKQYPDIQLGPSLRFFQGQQRWQINPGIELPLFNHNQGPVAEAYANRDMMASTFLRLQANMMTEADRVHPAFLSNMKEYETAKKSLEINEAREKETLEIFKTGDLTYIDVLSARLEVQLARQRLLQALRKLQVTIGSIEDVIQKPLVEKMESLPNLEYNPRTAANN